MREIYIRSNVGLLDIGRRGENLAARVHLAEVPESGQAVTVFIKRNGDTVAYPASNVEITDSEIIWTVTSVDTGKSGRGKVQYRFADSVTGKVIKTEIYHFVVGLAIDTEVGPAPDPYESWLDSLTDLAGQAQVAARDAEADATRAAESAEQAETSAQNAEQSASSAGESADLVQMAMPIFEQIAQSTTASADAASNSAIQAQVASERAVTAQMAAESAARQASASAESASASKTAAEDARQRAYQWAQNSQTYSEAASASAGRARASETSAGQSATAASASASSASQSATTATAKAAEASASATTAATKASEASASATAAQEARTGAETAQAGAESAAQTAQAGADAVGLLKEQIYNSYPNVEAEEGPIVSISDGADGIPVKSLVVGIEPVQAGSGDPSPTNVRPITGWTGATVQRTRKNLLDDTYADTSNNNFLWIYRNVGFLLKANQTYTFSVNTIVNSIRIVSVDESVVYAQLPSPNKSLSYTPTSDILVVFRVWVNGGGTLSGLNPQIELGSTATAFEPYQGDTYPITFPSSAGTVYGGSLDVTNGVLTVDRAMVDLGSLNWNYVSQFNCYYSYLIRTSGQQEAKIMFNAICSNYPFVGRYQLLVDKSCSYIYNQAIAVRDSAYADVAAFKAAMSGVQLIYELATPVTYQLTPTEVKTLLGTNNIWADTGDVEEMAYRADTKLYIDGVYEEYQDDLADYADALAALG